jgi:tRNA nucleotidyltransferase/poly(A) polymerase
MLVEALSDPEIHELYRQKLASVRAGDELRKLMGGDRPGEALRQLFETGMYRAVFDTPEFNQLADYKMDQQNAYHKHNLLDHTIMVIEQLNDIMRSQGVDDETRMLMNFAALLHDSGKAYPGIQQPKVKDPSQMSYKGHADKSEVVADEVLKHIGIGRQARSLINQVIRHHMIHDFPDAPIYEVGDPTKMPDEMSKSDRKAFKKYYEKLHNLLQAVKPIQKEVGKEGEKIPSRPYSQDEIARLIFMHGAADARSKGEEELQPVDVPGALDPYSRHWENMQNYYDFWSTMKPMPGNEIQQLVESEFAARGWEMPKSQAYTKYVVDKLKRAQATGVVVTREDSVNYIKSMMLDIQQRYSQPKKAWVYDNVKCVNS